jgi:hypothetical protein
MMGDLEGFLSYTIENMKTVGTRLNNNEQHKMIPDLLTHILFNY